MTAAQEADIRRVLLQDQQARLLTAVAPDLARWYARNFAQSVRTLTESGSDTAFGPSRNVLWGDNGPTIRSTGTNLDGKLPNWYAQSHPLCSSCSLPLVPGISAHHRTARASRRLIYVCDACGKHQSGPKKTTKVLPSVRSRRRMRQQILAGKAAPPESSSHASIGVPRTVHGTAPKHAKHTAAHHHTDTPPGAEARRKSIPAASTAPSLATSASPPTAPRALHAPSAAGAHAPLAPARKPKKGAMDHKEGLRALLQQKQSQPNAPPKPRGGLADFLSQL